MEEQRCYAEKEGRKDMLKIKIMDSKVTNALRQMHQADVAALIASAVQSNQMIAPQSLQNVNLGSMHHTLDSQGLMSVPFTSPITFDRPRFRSQGLTGRELQKLVGSDPQYMVQRLDAPVSEYSLPTDKHVIIEELNSSYRITSVEADFETRIVRDVLEIVNGKRPGQQHQRHLTICLSNAAQANRMITKGFVWKGKTHNVVRMGFGIKQISASAAGDGAISRSVAPIGIAAAFAQLHPANVMYIPTSNVIRRAISIVLIVAKRR